MVYSGDRFFVAKELKETKLTVNIRCDKCNNIGENVACAGHNALSEEVTLKTRHMPWSIKNKITSKSMSYDANGGNAFFDVDFFNKECLKYIIVEAPWGPTNDMLLLQANDDFGAALETLVPKAFTQTNAVPTIEQVKKEPVST